MFSGCKRIEESIYGRYVEEGIVHYDVTFPYTQEEGMMASMLPTEMTMKFEPGRYVTEITAGMGLFKMRFVADNEKKVLRHTLDMVKEKLMVEMNEEGAEQMLKKFPTLKIEKTSGTDSLAGLPCKKALGFYADQKEPPMDISYTDRISLKDPNWCNQFHELDGVLMGYEVMRFGKRMRLRATDIQAKEVPDSVFSTSSYKKVSIDKMNRTMEKLMESF